ncbi:MAG: glycosyltransferase, partial [Oceanococcaceae bacterium]
MDRSWSLSIVSHGHGPAISQQLRSLSRLPTAAQAELLLTLNLPGEAEPDLGAWPGCVRFLRNAQPQSFAANHNAAARAAAGTYFACLDPDLEWLDDPFPALADWLDQPGQGLAAPCILDEHGRLADHARPPPTPCSVLRRRLGGEDDGLPEPREPQPVPWLAGLFLASRRQTWLQLGGFDERYRLYAEDVELGLRCCVRGLGVSR